MLRVFTVYGLGVRVGGQGCSGSRVLVFRVLGSRLFPRCKNFFAYQQGKEPSVISPWHMWEK